MGVASWDLDTDPYDYADRHGENGDNEYDYEIPYWKPSNKKAELLSQITKLRLTFISNEHIQ